MSVAGVRSGFVAGDLVELRPGCVAGFLYNGRVFDHDDAGSWPKVVESVTSDGFVVRADGKAYVSWRLRLAGDGGVGVFSPGGVGVLFPETADDVAHFVGVTGDGVLRITSGGSLKDDLMLGDCERDRLFARAIIEAASEWLSRADGAGVELEENPYTYGTPEYHEYARERALKRLSG